MKSLVIKSSGNAEWDKIAILLNGEIGTVSSEFSTSGEIFYNGVFLTYGGEFTWIPDECCTVNKILDPS